MKQAKPWWCYPTAISIITGIPVEELVQAVGHDGSDILFPDSVEPYNHAAFVYPEMALACLKHGWALIPIAIALENPRPKYPHWRDLLALLTEEACVIVAKKPDGFHCWAHDGTIVWDPFTGEKAELPIPYPISTVELLRRICP